MNLKNRDHETLLRWAATCAERVLPLFEAELPRDRRPRRAIEAARRILATGETTMRVVRKAALDSHAAARAAKSEEARLAARAAGHAVATAHVASHARGMDYAVRAVEASGGTGKKERAWQRRILPKHLLSFVFPSQVQKARWRRGEGSPHWPGTKKK